MSDPAFEKSATMNWGNGQLGKEVVGFGGQKCLDVLFLAAIMTAKTQHALTSAGFTSLGIVL